MITISDAIDADVAEALPGVHRVAKSGRTIGFVLEAGDRFVSLFGPVYNTSVEIGQTRELRTAVQLVLAH